MRIFLFDIDGTLISTGGAGSAALFMALGEAFGVDDPAEVAFSGRTDRAIARSMFEAHGIEDSTDNWRRLREVFVRVLPEQLSSRQGSVLPGVAKVLDQLSSHPSTTLGLLTGNTRDGARLKLGHYRLDGFFNFGGYGDDHFDRDDVAREAFAIARRLNGEHVNPRDVWVIGDTPFDVRCGRAIGANVAAVATGIHPADELREESPDVLLDDLSDVEAFLGQVG